MTRTSPMLRIAVATALLMLYFSLHAMAYSACDKYKYGSQEWWQCMADQGQR